MNFNLLFSTVSVLSFIIEFPVNTEERQDYFLFEGNNKSAHLFRENRTLYLHLTRGQKFSIYNTSIDDENFQFSWNGFAVNEKEMILQRSTGKMGQLDFEHFTFISPIVDVFDIECAVEPVYHNVENVNYWYFLFMMFAVAIVFDSKSMAMGVLKRFRNNAEGDYVTMDQGSASIQHDNINDSNINDSNV